MPSIPLQTPDFRGVSSVVAEHGIAGVKHLHNIKGKFVVRIVVPPELRAAVGKRELRAWLRSDKKPHSW